jgi:hypothetical protein
MEFIQLLLAVGMMLIGHIWTPTTLLQPPDGLYTTMITRSELISIGMSDHEACENAGTYTLVVTGDRWRSSQSALLGCNLQNATDSGAWAFTGDQVKFHEDAFLGCTTDYIYEWSFDGSDLHFTPVEDSCTPRVLIQSAHPWVKQQ